MKADHPRNLLDKYLKQMIIIHKKGNPAYYNNMRRLAAIDRLQIINQQLSSLTPPKAAMLIERNASLIYAILPHHTNRNYIATKKRVDQLIYSCIILKQNTLCKQG